ncbi:hypothetical protein [Polaribacter ponticola]|uniref:DUF4252 domain-containing protein n=1 Tax=Polaribacter ponticola TaxID=2978475 RepID=A0ABT5SAM0_9FLAO|nr:hypothetical protein [Polaribacter sp. MSW5]MDD7915162.1 hypothetical protein [Polaribacter sp. MSW5]
MNKILLILLMSSTVFYSQKKEHFKSGTEVLKFKKLSSFKIPKSILFEFSGDTHLIYYYLDLSKKIEKRFNKEEIKVEFNYNLTEGTYDEDLKKIPKKISNPKNYDAFCKMQIKSFKNLKRNKIGEMKQVYDLELNLLENEKTVLKATLNIKTYNTILTKNNRVSKDLLKMITN